MERATHEAPGGGERHDPVTDKKPLKVLHVIPGMAAASGPTQAVVEMAVGLAELGHEVEIAYLEDRLPNQVAIDRPGIEQVGFSVRWLRHWGYSPPLRTFLQERIPGVDMVHIHSLWLYPTLAAATLARRHGIPYVIRPIGSLASWSLEHRGLKKAMYFRLVERRLLNRASAIHVASEREAREVEGLGLAPPTRVIPNPVDVELFDLAPAREEARARLGLPVDVPTFLFLGRIHPVKGLELMPSVHARLRQQVGDVRFLVVGPEDDREYAEALREDIAAKGLSDAVRFLGERRGQDKLVCLGAADALVLPSHTENFGMVVPEALASGVPVVASQHTPWEGLRLAGVGDWLPLATEPWVEALTRWIGKDRADSERCREYARAEFAKDQVLRRLASMYRDLARSAPLSDGL